MKLPTFYGEQKVHKTFDLANNRSMVYTTLVDVIQLKLSASINLSK